MIAFEAKINATASFENFRDLYHCLHMQMLASDLLDEGLSPKQISDAIVRAIDIANSSGINIREHFMPVFTSIGKEIMSDCKLSRLAYGLVLMNGESQLAAVGQWQVKVLEAFL